MDVISQQPDLTHGSGPGAPALPLISSHTLKQDTYVLCNPDFNRIKLTSSHLPAPREHTEGSTPVPGRASRVIPYLALGSALSKAHSLLPSLSTAAEPVYSFS